MTRRAPVPEPEVSLRWEQVRAWRFARHHLDHAAPRKALIDVVSDLCGLHAQLMSSAELSACARVAGLGREDVQAALWKQRTLVKTWAMRGTLHVLAARDFGVWQPALNTFDHYLRPSWAKYFGVTPSELLRTLEAINRSLEGQELTRQELATAVARATRLPKLKEALMGSWGALLKPAAYRGALCFAKGDGAKARFTNPRTWLKGIRPLDEDTALAEVTRRYLAAYAPATAQELGRWWGLLTPAQVRSRLARLGEEVVAVDVEGTPAWALRASLPALKRAKTSKSVRLLPAFDPYVIGAGKLADHFLPSPGFKPRVYRPQAWISPVIAVGGRMDGTWKSEVRGSRVRIELTPFVPFSAKSRKLAEADAVRTAKLLGGELELSWTNSR